MKILSAAPTASTIDAVHNMHSEVIGPMTDYQIGPQYVAGMTERTEDGWHAARRAVDTQCTQCGAAVTLLGSPLLQIGIDRELTDDDEIAIVLAYDDASRQIVCGACADRAVNLAPVEQAHDVAINDVVDACGDGVFDVPDWIDSDITIDDVRSVVQGGCNSGAYMPAVTYRVAQETMTEHGDDVLAYIEGAGLAPPPIGDGSWTQYACVVLSMAVELWCASTESTLDDDDHYVLRDADDI